MYKIVCTKCGKEVEIEGILQEGGDNTTFVCKECQEAINIPSYKDEIAELKSKSERTESEDRRIEFLNAKLFGEVLEED